MVVAGNTPGKYFILDPTVSDLHNCFIMARDIVYLSLLTPRQFPSGYLFSPFKYFSKYTNIEMSTFKGEGGGSQEINPRPLKQ